MRGNDDIYTQPSFLQSFPLHTMVTQNLLLLTCSSSLLILLLFHQTSQAITHDCTPSFCGIISNISSPFRLKDDPKHCGDPRYELACENNATFIYLYSHKYQVKAITYENYTIRVADVSITNNTCSFPNYSLYRYNIIEADVPDRTFDLVSMPSGEAYPYVAWPIHFMSCPYTLNNSFVFTDVTHCNKTSNSSDGRYSYVEVGNINASDVNHLCSLDIIVMTSWKFQDFKNISLSEIHDSLLYAMDLNCLGPTTLSTGEQGLSPRTCA